MASNFVVCRSKLMERGCGPSDFKIYVIGFSTTLPEKAFLYHKKILFNHKFPIKSKHIP